MNLESNVQLRTQAVQAKNRKVLLVENDPFWQAMISGTIKSIDKSIQMQFVKSAEEAELLLQIGARYDLVIADQYLDSNVTGISLWKNCKSTHKSMPFMIISGLKKSEFFELFESENGLGTSGIEKKLAPLFLEKPYKREHFELMLNWQLGRPVGKLQKNGKISK